MDSHCLGRLNFNSDEEVFKSPPISVSALGGAECTFVFDELDVESKEFPKEYEIAVRNFLALPEKWRDCLVEYLWSYYQDVAESIGRERVPDIAKEEILNGIKIGSDVSITWDYDENDVYVSLESGCDWEIEHGLQITLKNGEELAKVGPYDGHVTNADAYDRDDFVGVIYVSLDKL